VVLVDDPDLAWLEEAWRGNARGILPRQASDEEILAALRAAAAGLKVVHPQLAERLQQFPNSPDGVALSAREIEILGLASEGLSNRQIATELNLSEHTVKFHLGSIFNKLGANTRAEAVKAGIRRGFVKL
jgi:DNA-binding NarL/FixJ family response regulator